MFLFWGVLSLLLEFELLVWWWLRDPATPPPLLLKRCTSDKGRRNFGGGGDTKAEEVCIKTGTRVTQNKTISLPN